MLSQARIARRATGSGAAASALASVGLTSAASPSSRLSSSPSRSAERTRSGTTSRSAIALSNGRSSWRTRLRRNRGLVFVGSSTGLRPKAAHSCCVSLRRRPSNGRVMLGRIADRPVAPLPRSSASSTVSAWSSAVWPVNASGPSRSKRAARALASKFAPSSSSARLQVKITPRRSAIRSAAAASSSASGRIPWWTWTATTSSSAATASASRALESGPPEKPQVTFVPGDGKAHRARSSPLSRIALEVRGLDGGVAACHSGAFWLQH